MSSRNFFGLTVDYLANFTCLQNHFLCRKDLICINSVYVCDGIQDCPSNEDEDCIIHQSAHQCFNSTQTISYSLICDSYEDCEDGSDETNCGMN